MTLAINWLVLNLRICLIGFLCILILTACSGFMDDEESYFSDRHPVITAVLMIPIVYLVLNVVIAFIYLFIQLFITIGEI